MGKIKNIITKAALGIAAAVGAGAAIASSAKKKYKETKESYQANTGGTAGANAQSNYKGSNNASSNQTQRGTTVKSSYDTLREQKRKQRELQNRIYELSKISLSQDSFGKSFGLFLLTILILSLVLGLCLYDKLSSEKFVLILTQSILLIAYIFILIRSGIFKNKIKTAKEKIDALSYRLKYLEEEKERNHQNLYADLDTEIYIYTTSIKNVITKYNKFVSSFPNSIYSKAFAITPIDAEYKEEKIVVNCTRK